MDAGAEVVQHRIMPQTEIVTKTTSTQEAPGASPVVSTEVTQAVTDEPAPVKPGYKTTEFWFKIAAFVLTTLYASGVMTSSTVLSVAGIAASVLTALGYAVSRALVKSA